jgi:hypothetical protein
MPPDDFAGCVFRCSYCHISGDRETALFRASQRNECTECSGWWTWELKHVIEDDTLFGHKQRALEVLRDKGYGFTMWDINR